MTLITDLYNHVTTHSAVTALIGTRLYPNSLPQEPTLPAASWLLVSDRKTYAHDGPTGFGQPRVQVDAYAPTPAGAAAVAAAIEAALDDWHRVNGRYAAFLENRQALAEPELQRHRVTTDYLLNREEE